LRKFHLLIKNSASGNLNSHQIYINSLNKTLVSGTNGGPKAQKLNNSGFLWIKLIRLKDSERRKDGNGIDKVSGE
jgi:hypothetical protein